MLFDGGPPHLSTQEGLTISPGWFFLGQHTLVDGEIKIQSLQRRLRSLNQLPQFSLKQKILLFSLIIFSYFIQRLKLNGSFSNFLESNCINPVVDYLIQ